MQECSVFNGLREYRYVNPGIQDTNANFLDAGKTMMRVSFEELKKMALVWNIIREEIGSDYFDQILEVAEEIKSN